MTASEGLRSVVAAFDGSPAATRAVHFALELAQASGAHLYLVHAREHDPEQAEPSTEEESRSVEEAVAAAVAGWADRASERGVPFTAVWRDSGPALAILTVAREVDAGLIVVGTRGLRPLPRAWVGSVAARVLASAQRPVAVVP